MKKICGVLFFVFSVALPVSAQTVSGGTKVPAIIPYPSSVNLGAGEFVFTPQTTVVADAGFDAALAALQKIAQQAFGKTLAKSSAPRIQLLKDESIAGAEGYKIVISAKQVVLSAKDPAGMFRAVQTLRQLAPVEVEKNTGKLKKFTVPVLTVSDEPAFAWRGLHLDVARHFFSIDYIKRLLDRMALYKLNKLHLHLTDDQGWRLEIKKYPLLTEQGAWRVFDKNDSLCMRQAPANPDMALEPQHVVQRQGKTMYGGFYTQDQIKDLVQYAADRYIDIIPEIDMPGHMMTAIHAYPELSCEGGSKWGELFSTPICPCKESTFEFAQNIFTEVMALFPSEFIHLGADEVDRKTWAQSELCQELMKKEGLTDVAELQSYFVKRMEKFFQSRGRKLIGWDEILEGGVSPTANVMYWRAWVPAAPVHAAKNGNHVIMSPGNPLYFDNPPDGHSLSDIYHFSVVPKGLTAQEGRFIIGAQANLWTERVPSDARADYMYFPRTLALAERVWSTSLDFSSFSQRLVSHYSRLDALGVHYRLPDLVGLSEENVFTDQKTVYVKPPLPGLTIRYTTDGTTPTANATAMNKSLVIRQPTLVRLAAFNATGLRGDVYSLNYKKESFLEPEKTTDVQQGLSVRYYKKLFKSATRLETVAADSQYVAASIVRPEFNTAPSFGLKFDGFIDVPETGIYSFYLLVDDGGILTIGDKVVVNNDGHHAPIEKSGQIALKKGLHRFRLDFIEGGGGYTLDVKYGMENGAPTPIPASWLKFKKG